MLPWAATRLLVCSLANCNALGPRERENDDRGHRICTYWFTFHGPESGPNSGSRKRHQFLDRVKCFIKDFLIRVAPRS